MVCQRCVESVQQIFEEHNAKILEIDLGTVKIDYDERFDEFKISKILENRGFEMLKDKEKVLVEQIKVAITKLFFHEKQNENLKNSVWLENEVGVSYQKLCKVFSKETNTTIEKYIILSKIERVKELISYNKMNFEEISKALGYKNLSHLSTQFKKIENKSLSEFKNDINQSRKRLDEIL
jgi:AraC family transcriptional regulator